MIEDALAQLFAVLIFVSCMLMSLTMQKKAIKEMSDEQKLIMVKVSESFTVTGMIPILLLNIIVIMIIFVNAMWMVNLVIPLIITAIIWKIWNGRKFRKLLLKGNLSEKHYAKISKAIKVSDFGFIACLVIFFVIWFFGTTPIVV